MRISAIQVSLIIIIPNGHTEVTGILFMHTMAPKLQADITVQNVIVCRYMHGYNYVFA
jgi:hypothetical protein